jgi:hypothetical protein
LEIAEHTVTELPLVLPKVIDPRGPPAVPVKWHQEFADSKHHVTFYRALAVTRFADYFPVGTTQTNPLPGPFRFDEANKTDSHGRSDWDWHRVNVPAAKRPDEPIVREAPPVFQWDPCWNKAGVWNGRSTEWSFSRTRTSGCRIWLERPWFSSGPNEKLAVLCMLEPIVVPETRNAYLNIVSRWGKDPVQEKEITEKLGLLTIDQILSAEPGSPRDLPAPLAPPSGNGAKPAVSIEIAGNLRVGAAVHTPIFHAQERAWFCDVFLKIPRYAPFVWLSLARYQPHALEGLCLSPRVRVENPVQIWPVRTLSIRLSLDAGQLRARVRVHGLGPEASPQRLLCRVERLIRPEETFADSRPVDDVSAIGNVASIPPTIDGSDMWKSITFLDFREAPCHESELARDPQGWTTDLNILPAADWPPSTRLRVVLSETEVYFPAYSMMDSASRLYRPTYEETVEVPSAALRSMGVG